MDESEEREMWEKVRKKEDEEEIQELDTVAIHSCEANPVTMVELFMDGKFLIFQINNIRHIWDMTDPKNNPALRKKKAEE